MIGTFVLMLGSLLTTQSNGPDYWPSVSCNKQGTVFDSVWMHNYQNSPVIYYERNAYKGAPSDGGGKLLPSYKVNGVVYSGTPNTPTDQPPASVDTDDSSSTAPNFAAVWCAQYTYPNSGNPTIPFCTVNGYNPFPVGYNSSTGSWVQGTTAWVAVTRQLTTYAGHTAMAVAVAFQNSFGAPYIQTFLVNPSTGVPYTQGNPVQAGGQSGQDLALGGISGDDYGNFVLTYVSGVGANGRSPWGVYLSGFHFANDQFAFKDYAVTTYQNATDYVWCRVACYHGTSATSGGFVVGYGDLNASRYTTNWSSNPILAGTANFNNDGLEQNESQTAWWGIACQRDAPGNYMLTWSGQLSTTYGENQEQINVLLGQVTADIASPLQYITDWGGNEYMHPAGYGLTPSVAVSDHAYGWLYQVDYCTSKNGTNPPGAVTGAYQPAPGS